MIKTIRKGAKVRLTNQTQEHADAWGTEFEVFRKEGQSVRLVSLKKPYFRQCMTCGIDKVKIIK